MLSLSVVNGCGDVTSQQTVYFESPNYPQAVREMMICVLIINVRKGVQQLRLDFQMFEVHTFTINMIIIWVNPQVNLDDLQRIAFDQSRSHFL